MSSQHAVVQETQTVILNLNIVSYIVIIDPSPV